MKATHNQQTEPPTALAAHLGEKTFPPLALETRVTVSTDCAAFHLGRRPQTLRAWACLENGPIRPIRIHGRLAWPVSNIRSLLEGGE